MREAFNCRGAWTLISAYEEWRTRRDCSFDAGRLNRNHFPIESAVGHRDGSSMLGLIGESVNVFTAESMLRRDPFSRDELVGQVVREIWWQHASGASKRVGAQCDATHDF